jgi:hypothetical protein
MPIRVKEGSQPKYRMVHATNHPDGCIAMADNMIRRADELYRDVQSCGQLSLLGFDVNQDIKPDESLLREGLLKIIRKESDSLIDKIRSWGLEFTSTPNSDTVAMRLNSIIAKFFCANGVVCSSKDIIDVLKRLEADSIIDVSRIPARTPRGAVSSFWSDDKGKVVLIKIKGALP